MGQIAAAGMLVMTVLVAFPTVARAAVSVTGRVVDGDVAPIAAVDVHLVDPVWGVEVATQVTVADGTYAIAVEPGSYRVYFRDPSGARGDRFWGGAGGVATWSQSAVVTVDDDGAVLGDVVMPEHPVIEGTVTGPGGIPLGGIQVEIGGGGYGWGSAFTSTAPDGTFSHVLPSAGGYYVLVRDPAGTYGTVHHPGVAPWPDATIFDVVDGDVVDASIEMPIAGTVTGTVVAGSTPVPNMGALVVDAPSSDLIDVALTASDGSFAVDGLPPGSYKVAIVDPMWFFDSPDRAFRPVVVPSQDVESMGLVAAVAAGSTFAVGAATTTDIGTQPVVGHSCDPMVVFEGADLSGVDLSGDYLRGCPLTEVDLEDADLSGTDMRDVDLTGATLAGADLTAATFLDATGVPVISVTTVLSGTTCPSGAVSSTTCDEWVPSFTVTHGGDAIDDDPGDGRCHDLAGVIGACSLRAAVMETNALPTADVVTVDPAVTSVDLTLVGALEDLAASGDLDVSGDLTIDAGGATVDAHGLDRVFHIIAGGSLELRDLTATGGLVSAPGAVAGVGGGVLVQAGAFIAEDVTVDSNGAVAGGALGVVGGGSATVRRSTLSHGTAASAGGGVYLGTASDQVTLIDSTVSTNAAPVGGGIQSVGALELRHVTIAANSGGGISRIGGTVSLAGTIVGAQASGPGCAGVTAATGAGYNLDADMTCGLGAATDVLGANPLLTALGDNGGATATHLPTIGSAAIDAIPAGAVGLCDLGAPTDQRGSPRPDGPACDIGAVEGSGAALTPLALVVDDPADLSDAEPGDGVCDTGSGSCTLRAAIDEANAAPTTDLITLTVDPVLAIPGADEDGNATGDLDPVGWLAIDGDDHVIDGSQLDRVLHARGAELALTNLTLTGGEVTGGGGGVWNPNGRLDLTSVAIRSNQASGKGGGVLNGRALSVVGSTIADNTGSSGGGVSTSGSSSVASVEASTISGNTAVTSGGGLAVANGGLHLAASTISDNAASSGAGLWVTSGAAATVTRSTIAANLTASGGSAVIVTSGSAVVGASILATDQGRSACNTAVTSAGFNIGSDATCGLTAPTDAMSVNPLLYRLADAGGATETHVPAFGSPAVDAVPAGTLGLCDASSPSDQRGAVRPSGGACDIGAVEGVGPAMAPLSLVVDDAADLPDADPGDGVCDAGAGTCTLRAAIDETNARATADTITLTVDPVLSLVGANDERNATGDLDIYGTLDLHGVGHVIDAGGIDRAMHTWGHTVTIDAVTVTGGVASGRGGGLANARGDLTLAEVVVTGNSAAWEGGGIANGSAGGGGLLTVSASTIEGNQAPGGGGVYTSGSAVVLDSTIADNIATSSDGGGVTAGSGLVVSNSTIARNSATDGGGIAKWGNAAPMTLVSSAIVDNVASSVGGGVSIQGAPASPNAITSTTIARNTAALGSAMGNSGTVVISASTLSGNQATGADGAVRTSGAGASTTITRSTIWNNTGDAAGVALANESGTTTVAASIIGSDLGRFSCSGSVTSGGYNVVADASCAFAGPGDQNDLNPVLASLADNGGSTATHLPGPTSPARDAVPVGEPGLCDASSPIDQREFARPAGAGCDAGAVEGVGAAVGPLVLVVDDPADAGDASPGDGQCDAGVGTCTLRAAVDEADAVPTSDTIVLAVDPVLSLAGTGEDVNATGDLDPIGWLTVDGAGHTIDAGGIDRAVHAAGNRLALTDVTVTGGSATDGAALANEHGLVVAADVSLAGNVATNGGAIHNRALLQVTTSTFTGNSATNGGALYDTGARAATSIHGAVVTGNSATNAGGGIFSSGATTEVAATAVSNNTAAKGGGLYGGSTSLTIDDGTVVSGNAATGSGAGIHNDLGTVRVVDSVVTDNRAYSLMSPAGGGIAAVDGTTFVESSVISVNRARSGGGVYVQNGAFEITASMIVSNRAEGSGWGGGIRATSYASVTTRDSLIADNHAWEGGGAASATNHLVSMTFERTEFRDNAANKGGAVIGRATLRDSTLVGNSAGMGGAVYSTGMIGAISIVSSTIAGNTAATGGGIYAGGPVTMTMSTVADNFASISGGGMHAASASVDVVQSTIVGNVAPVGGSVSGTARFSGSIVAAEGGGTCATAVTSLGYNVATDASCGLNAPTDMQSAGLLVGPLTDNGGPTSTRLPYAGSPAVNAIPAGTPGLCDGTLATDQRGVLRPEADACDRGSVEGVGGPAVPLAFVVDDPADLADATPGDGVCDAGAGTCTVRAAIAEANGSPTADIVTLAVDPVLSIDGDFEETNRTGDLDVVGDLLLDGDGHTIDGGGLDRVLDLWGPELTTVDLGVAGGASAGDGGGIRVSASTMLDLTSSSVSTSTAAHDGGGVYNNGGTVNIGGSTIDGNAATGGGGVFNDGGTVVVMGSTVSGNTATSDGGGLGVVSAPLTVTSSIISGNTARYGGGLWVKEGSATVSASTVSANTARHGGGLYASVGGVEISTTTVTGNSALYDGGGVGTSGIGVTATVATSTISGNAAGRHGGGIHADYGSVSLVNSTVSGNTAGVKGGGLYNTSDATSSLVFTTVAENSSADTGGLANVGGSLSVSGTIIHSTSGSACSGTITSKGYNRSNDTSCGLGGLSNKQGVDLVLGPLAANGGPTWTHLPGVGSPARDAIFTNVAVCIAHSTDQRLQPRPQGIRCDVGSVDQ